MVRLADDSSAEAKALSELLQYRLPLAADESAIRSEWFQLIDGSHRCVQRSPSLPLLAQTRSNRAHTLTLSPSRSNSLKPCSHTGAAPRVRSALPTSLWLNISEPYREIIRGRGLEFGQGGWGERGRGRLVSPLSRARLLRNVANSYSQRFFFTSTRVCSPAPTSSTLQMAASATFSSQVRPARCLQWHRMPSLPSERVSNPRFKPSHLCLTKKNHRSSLVLWVPGSGHFPLLWHCTHPAAHRGHSNHQPQV